VESVIRACGELSRKLARFFRNSPDMKTSVPPVLIAFSLAWFALAPTAQAVVPPPDGGYPNFNTAEGQNALFGLTTGSANTAVGWSSLFSNTDGSFNTAVGAGTLLFNVGNQIEGDGVQNTAVGAAALLFNTTGVQNTAVGTTALLNNTTGGSNTANGGNALVSNTTGDVNTAIGVAALPNNTAGSRNIALGAIAGSAVTTANNVICIGVPGANVSDTCFIGNISGVEVTGDPVVVDANGQLGVAPAGSPLSANELLKQQHVVQELKATTERQAAVIALQEGQIKALTAGLQKVSAQLEASKPAPQVANNP
jgi:hypothetical protein